jgi:hypothetical protein
MFIFIDSSRTLALWSIKLLTVAPPQSSATLVKVSTLFHPPRFCWMTSSSYGRINRSSFSRGIACFLCIKENNMMINSLMITQLLFIALLLLVHIYKSSYTSLNCGHFHTLKAWDRIHVCLLWKLKPYCFTEIKCLRPSLLRTWNRLIFGSQAFSCFEVSNRLYT